MKNEIIIYENKGVKLEVNMKDETVWLSLEKAANLLYYMIKDHPYADVCKRIAASLFLEF